MITPKEFGNIFKEAREKQRISVKKVTTRVRIHPDVVADIENGVYDKLSEIYIKSFIKKYADFLGLDAGDMLEKYKSFHKMGPKSSSPPLQKQKQKKDIKKSITYLKITEMWAGKETQLLGGLAIALAVLLVISVIVVIGKTGAKPPAAEKKETAARSVSGKKPAASESLILTLIARGKAWVQVYDGTKKVFVGTLDEGDRKTLESKGTLTVQTGKGENLYFNVNGRYIGKVADGVVRDIAVSKEGIKKGNKWLARLD